MSERTKSAGLTSGLDRTFELRMLKALSPARVQQLLGDRYTVIRELGAGGTSVVFLAHDHMRDLPVAVKVLRPELSVAVVAARFLREIEIGQRLDHANVLPIYEYGSADGELYCTMPFVDGETLRQRLAREKQLSIEDALRIGRATADALDHAHGFDIVHRDIKPANILLAKDRVVVADFGMARAMTAAASGDLTETGLVLGTAAYMSPEQGNAERALDGRSDVYSLGCVVYEMLAGEAPFTGPTQQAIIARHTQEPPRSLRVIRPAVPVGVQHAVEKALAKVPADRFATAGEFLDALYTGARGVALGVAVDHTGIAVGAQPGTGPSPALGDRSGRRHGTSRVMPWVAAGFASLVALAAGVGWWRAADVPSPEPRRFTIDVPEGEFMSNAGIALSRDGKLLAFRTALRGTLYLRRSDRLEPVAHPKAIGAYDFFFSPGGKSLLYTRGGGPTIIPTDSTGVNTEPKRLWAPLGHGWAGIGWMDSSSVLHIFADTLWRIPIDGGPRQALAAMDATVDANWRQPVMLPDGKTIAIRVTLRGAASPNDDRLALVSIDGGARTLLDLESKGAMGYIDGVLIFGSVDGRIMGVRFDLARRRPLGAPVALVDSVDFATLPGGPLASVSDNGTLAYLVTIPRSLTQIVDERANVIQEISDSRLYYQTVWSPDGKRIALYAFERSQRAIGVYDVERRHLTMLPWTTSGFFPVWTADGSRIAFTGWVPGVWTGGQAVWVVPDGRSRPEPIPGTSTFGPTIVRSEFSPDGKHVVVRPEYRAGEPPDKPHAFAIPLAGGSPFAVIHGAPRPDNPEVSPNGRWIAYTAVDSVGQPSRVYLEPFPRGSWRVRVSAGAGVQPRWSGDGRTLFYLGGGKIRRATLDTSGAMPRVVRTDSLFYGPAFTERPIRSWDVHPDGRHFVLARDVGGGTKLVVVENWMTEVRKKLAGK